MPDKEIIFLPSAGSIPGFPGSHGPGTYEADYTTRTLRRVVDGVPVDELGEADGLYMIGEPDSHHAAQGALEVLPIPAPVQEAAPLAEATPAASERQIEAPAPEEVPAPIESQPAAPIEASEAQPEPSDPAAEAAHEA